MRKLGSRACCVGTFHCPTSLAITLPKTISSSSEMFYRKRTIEAERDRKRQLAKEASSTCHNSNVYSTDWRLEGIISVNMLKYAKHKNAHICKKKLGKNMKKICTNMQNQICKTKYAFQKICTNMHYMPIYAVCT